MILRDYLDYNATSPLSQSVLDYLGKGDLPFANPSSIHSTGKSANSIIDEVSDIIIQTFNLHKYKVLFHSGATEAVNTIFSSLTSGDALVYSSADHPCVIESAQNCRDRSVETISFSPDENGDFDENDLIIKIQNLKKTKNRVVLNYTYVHNETGVIWPLEVAANIKKQTGCEVHVDAVQCVGKIYDLKLDDTLDMYSFSAHKFGALKSVGFSVMQDYKKFGRLLFGGGQQHGYRAGTENVIGIKSCALALGDVKKAQLSEIEKFRDEIETLFASKISNQEGFVVARNAKYKRSINTSLLLSKKQNADFLLIAFDMLGLDVSMGAACSSKSLKKSHVLSSMGIKYDQNAIRISIGPKNLERKKEILENLSKAFEKFH